MKTKAQVKRPSQTISVTNEVIELMDKVKSIQFERLGIKLKRTQTLVLVLKDYIAREEDLAS
jgi:hypothetical protein